VKEEQNYISLKDTLSTILLARKSMQSWKSRNTEKNIYFILWGDKLGDFVHSEQKQGKLAVLNI
jgi:hypothetical protein